jgi:hypothetical protein
MLITKKREIQQRIQNEEQIKTEEQVTDKNSEVISMLNESAIISYSTPNYEKLTYIYNESLKKIGVKDENIKHKTDSYDSSIFINDGFQSKLWYYAVTNKINHLISVLENYKMNNSKKYFIFSDCDILFIEKNKEKWTELQLFIDENQNDIFFMREHTSELVNTGFFIIKNNKNIKYIITFFKNVLFNLLNREKRTMELGDQTIINEMLHNINYDFIPNDYIIYATTIYNNSKSLIHHAVYCKSVDEKITQINFIKSMFT